MVQFNPINFISKSFNLETKKNAPTTTTYQKTTIEKGNGLDTFEFSTKNGEKFQDVFNEMSAHVPDMTTTIEEIVSHFQQKLKDFQIFCLIL